MPTTDEQALIDLQVAWMDAWRRQDRAVIEAILAPEFTLTSARTDQILDRAEWLGLRPGEERGLRVLRLSGRRLR